MYCNDLWLNSDKKKIETDDTYETEDIYESDETDEDDAKEEQKIDETLKRFEGLMKDMRNMLKNKKRLWI